jgi:putative transposase
VTVYRFIERERASHHLATMCRVLKVSVSGYRVWANRRPSSRSITDAALTERIRAIHAASRGTYGAPRVHAELQAEGTRVSRKRVARLMRSARLTGVHRRRWRRGGASGQPFRDATTAPDLVRRRFRVTGPDRLWVADITELPTACGPLFLAVVLDAWSRRVAGWAIGSQQTAELVTAAVETALEGRTRIPGLIHHSDRGTQYTSVAFGARLERAGIAASMGAPGSGYDNALAESFFASLETELIDRSRWTTHEQAAIAVVDWIEAFYNPVRRHSALGYLAPLEFERRYRPGTAA